MSPRPLIQSYCQLVGKGVGLWQERERFRRAIIWRVSLSEADWESLRSKGSVGKLHNLVYGIFRSNRLTYLLRDLQQDVISKADSLRERSRKPLTVVRGNDTRWLSQLHMIRRALKFSHPLSYWLSSTNRSGKMRIGRRGQARLGNPPDYHVSARRRTS